MLGPSADSLVRTLFCTDSLGVVARVDRHFVLGWLSLASGGGVVGARLEISSFHVRSRGAQRAVLRDGTLFLPRCLLLLELCRRVVTPEHRRHHLILPRVIVTLSRGDRTRRGDDDALPHSVPRRRLDFCAPTRPLGSLLKSKTTNKRRDHGGQRLRRCLGYGAVSREPCMEHAALMLFSIALLVH